MQQRDYVRTYILKVHLYYTAVHTGILLIDITTLLFLSAFVLI